MYVYNIQNLEYDALIALNGNKSARRRRKFFGDTRYNYKFLYLRKQGRANAPP